MHCWGGGVGANFDCKSDSTRVSVSKTLHKSIRSTAFRVETKLYHIRTLVSSPFNYLMRRVIPSWQCSTRNEQPDWLLCATEKQNADPQQVLAFLLRRIYTDGTYPTRSRNM